MLRIYGKLCRYYLNVEFSWVSIYIHALSHHTTPHRNLKSVLKVGIIYFRAKHINLDDIPRLLLELSDDESIVLLDNSDLSNGNTCKNVDKTDSEQRGDMT